MKENRTTKTRDYWREWKRESRSKDICGGKSKREQNISEKKENHGNNSKRGKRREHVMDSKKSSKIEEGQRTLKL